MPTVSAEAEHIISQRQFKMKHFLPIIAPKRGAVFTPPARRTNPLRAPSWLLTAGSGKRSGEDTI